MGELVDGVTATSISSIVDRGVTREGLVAKVFVFVLLVDNEQTFVTDVVLIEGSTAVGIMLADAVVLRRGDGATIEVEETARSCTSNNLEVATASVDDAGVMSLMMMVVIIYYDPGVVFMFSSHNIMIVVVVSNSTCTSVIVHVRAKEGKFWREM
jgi:hypothetical protein